MPNKNTHISWEAPEFQHHQKPTFWYIALLAVSIGLIVYAIISGSIITAITFALLGAVTFGFAQKKPSTLNFSVTSTGISIGQTFYPYKSIKQFWIIYNREVKTLNFETTAYLNRFLSIQLGTQDPIKLRNILKNYLEEDLDREESLTEKLARGLKF